MESLRIVFMGSPEFALPSLKVLHSSTHHVLAVVTGPDKRRGRGKSKSPTVVKKTAAELEIPVIEADNLKDPELTAQLKQLKPDLFVVVAFRILPPDLLEIPAIGSINLHASLLPAYRGAAPIHHAVMNGETETGCTVFFLDELVDTGNILIQEKTDIGPDETTGDIYYRLMNLGSSLILKSVNMIAAGSYDLKKQDERLATPAPRLFPDSCRINFNETAGRVYNKIRGLSPSPGAWTMLDGQRFRVHSASLISAGSPEKSGAYGTNLNDHRPDAPGTVFPVSETPDRLSVDIKPGELRIIDDAVLVGCSDGAIRLLEVQLEGKKSMKAADLFRGYKGLCSIE